MARPLWKGAISFGLVTIPVNVYSATRSETLRFRQLDRRDNTPIREKRVNEATGEEVAWDDIVKGYEYEEGSFVVLDQEDFTKANVKATETIDIVQAVPHDAIPAEYFERPMYVVPSRQGVKPYHILRETLRRSDRVAVAQIVMRGRQHLAALIADDRIITLELLRFADEIKPVEELGADDLLTAPDVRDKEVELGEQLVAALDEPWEPKQFHDEYREDLLELIEEKARTGRAPVKGRAPRERGAEVVDMMELLKKSVGEAKGRKGRQDDTEKSRRRKAS